MRPFLKLPLSFFPSFSLPAEGKAKAKAASTSSAQEKAAEGELGSSKEGHAGKLLQSREELPRPVLPRLGAGPRQQKAPETTAASPLAAGAGSSPRTKQPSKEKPAAAARSTAAPTVPVGCRRLLQETMEMSAQWDQRQSLASLYQERQKKAQAEWAAWEACFAGQAQELAQLASEESLSPKEESSRLVGPAVLAAIDGKSSVPVSGGHVELGSEETWAPHPPAEPRRKETKRRWRTAVNPPPVDEESAAAMLQPIQPK
ncbi:uncharacterized protein LOC135323919 [Dromaius novaehollandiae]|uniref:uncharacterized protein LOC135323919 n=1 Tax=Dromaius novaehollandiae TaxID=8790 RepID=UPI00311DF09A